MSSSRSRSPSRQKKKKKRKKKRSASPSKQSSSNSVNNIDDSSGPVIENPGTILANITFSVKYPLSGTILI